jgi:biopolymer transport protein ExbD
MKFLQEQSQNNVEVSLTPLVDIIFLLIIFFLVSSTFEKGEKNLGVELPVTKGSEKPLKKAKPWVIVIDQKGQYRLNDAAVSELSLENHLRKNKGQKDQIQVRIKADRRSPYGNVAVVLGLLEEFQYRKLGFTTLNPSE